MTGCVMRLAVHWCMRCGMVCIFQCVSAACAGSDALGATRRATTAATGAAAAATVGVFRSSLEHGQQQRGASSGQSVVPERQCNGRCEVRGRGSLQGGREVSRRSRRAEATVVSLALASSITRLLLLLTLPFVCVARRSCVCASPRACVCLIVCEAEFNGRGSGGAVACVRASFVPGRHTAAAFVTQMGWRGEQRVLMEACALVAVVSEQQRRVGNEESNDCSSHAPWSTVSVFQQPAAPNLEHCQQQQQCSGSSN
ncbi:unnamed protein product [Closterium sp. NIES-64]|nr:unnamed protein product [Closterium sp. NIES-64]